MKKLNFEELSLSEEVMKAIKDMGFEEASPIQSEAIPLLLQGRDVIGQAQTGTGKTVAFGIPIIEAIDTDLRKTQAIILCPTRELTIQVSGELAKLAKYKKGINIVPIYGGQSYERQFTALKRSPHVVIGTPGRVIDHLERETLNIENLKMFVLDEADEMLNMGFVEDIELILEKTPAEKQTVFFSATMPKQILNLTKKYQKNPEIVKVTHKELTLPNIEQIYFELKQDAKLEVLSRLIDVNNVKLGLVFCNTKRTVEEVVDQLQSRGYSSEALHGDMKQASREQIMKRFRSGNIELLVATDVAARGIDVDDIEAVFNYDIPYDEEYYVHRIGRTGRAGKTGKSFTFVLSKERFKVREIEKYTNTKMAYQRVPSFNEVEEVKMNNYLETLKETIKYNEGNLDKYVNIVEKLIKEEDYGLMEIAASLVKMNMGSIENPQKEENLEYKKVEFDKPISGKMKRLFINLGRKDNITPRDVLGAFAGETGLPGKMIGMIDIYDNFSFIEIPTEYVTHVIEVMNQNTIKGKSVNLEIANDKPKRDDDDRPARKPRGEFDSERPARRSRSEFDSDRPERKEFDSDRPARKTRSDFGSARPARKEFDSSDRPARRPRKEDSLDSEKPALRAKEAFDFDFDKPRRKTEDDFDAERSEKRADAKFSERKRISDDLNLSEVLGGTKKPSKRTLESDFSARPRRSSSSSSSSGRTKKRF